MDLIPICRAAHLSGYFDLFRSIGAPVERHLERARLPSAVEQMPKEYVRLINVLDWIGYSGRDIEKMELGCTVSGQLRIEQFAAPMRRRLREALTRHDALRGFLQMAETEDSALMSSMQVEGDYVRAILDLDLLMSHPLVCLVEWQNIRGIILAVNASAGAKATPKEITFVAAAKLPPVVKKQFTSTRILTGQRHTSALFDRATLASPPAAAIPETFDHTERKDGTVDPCVQSHWSFTSKVRALVRPYLGDGYPSVRTVADITGMSSRTLQRKLQDAGRSYSEIVQEARFDLASNLLHDPAIKIVDIAMACGYENPQHFSRAFRKLAGVTPRRYRESVEFGDDTQFHAASSKARPH